MKKFLAIFAVLALTVVSSVAMAEVTVSGSIDIRNLAHNNTVDFGSPSGTSDSLRVTQERVRLNIDGKSENAKGRITIENDWDNWGRVEAPQANSNAVAVDNAGNPVASDAGRLKLREAWLDFNLPFAGAHLKAGHQFLQLGNAWFFRSNKYGSDAWLLGFPGKNTFAFVNVKAAEANTSVEDDVDAFVLLDIYKLNDTTTVGGYLTHLRDPRGLFNASLGGTAAEGAMDNLGLHYNGAVGPIKLQAEFDYQTGSWDATPKEEQSGMQLVLQGTMPMDALSVNFTLAYGTGDDPTTAEYEAYMPLLDKDQHYTFVYEFFTKTAAGAKNTGFANTTALSVGADYKISNNLSVGGNLWLLQATEDVSLNGGALDSDLGMELDLRLGWKLNDSLSWNWQAGMLMAGKAYEDAAGKADDITAVQGVLSYKF